MGQHKALIPIDLDALEESGMTVSSDICKVCHVCHERPVVFQELILDESGSSGDEGTPSVARDAPPSEEDSDLDSMPELEDEVDLETPGIPGISRGVAITFQGGRVIFEREQGPLWQEVLSQMLAEQDRTVENN